MLEEHSFVFSFLSLKNKAHTVFCLKMWGRGISINGAF